MSDKILKLSQAQTLYQDLRGRIDALPTDSDIPEVPVQDVQVNGTSVLSSGIANVPVATQTTMGVMKVAMSDGAAVTNGGLYILQASGAQIKGGNTSCREISPYTQHLSVYYGLSKAAGADLASVTCTVGEYPDASKDAIQNMLGISDLISVREASTATAAHTVNSLFLMGGKLYKATSAIAVGDAVEVGTNCEIVRADEVFIKNTDIATSSTLGLIKTNANFGTAMRSIPNQDTLMIAPAGEQNIKEGVQGYQPIVPSRQHMSIYYGLSKLAGVDLANETVTLGQYPNTSKVAIRKMIDALGVNNIHDGLSVNTDVETGDWVLTTNVQDIQINGTSIVNNGVANIPLASSSTPGVMQVGTGLLVYNNKVMLSGPTESTIKAGSEKNTAVVPFRQHEAVYYGLSKLAGVDLASETVTVGTYPETSKTAINNMLGTVSKDSLDNAGITARTYTTKFDGEFSVTTVVSQDYISPYARANVTGRISKHNMHRITINGTEYILRTRLWFENTGTSYKVYEYLGNLNLYVDDISGVPGGTDNVPFIIISDLNNNGSIDVLTQAEGTYTIKVEQINIIQKELPKSLIYGDSYPPIERNNNGGTYNGVSIGVNELKNTRGTLALGYCNIITDDFGIAIGSSNKVNNMGYALGIKNIINASKGCAIGEQNTISGTSAIAIGTECTANGSSMIAVGIHNVPANTTFQRWSNNTQYHKGDIVTAVYNPSASATTPVLTWICLKNHTSESSGTFFANFSAHNDDWSLAPSTGDTIFVIGNGNSITKSNAMKVDFAGNVFTNGAIYVNCNADSTGGTMLPTDVQVNGTSVVSNGVANVPVASGTTLGVVAIANNGAHGLAMQSGENTGQLRLNPSDATLIKAGANAYRPIVPNTQHQSVFYGLAKAAGADMASSDNAIGTYTNAAKIAIRNMLGATSSNVIAVQDEQPTDTDTKVWLPETAPGGVEIPTMEDLAGYVKKTDYATSSTPGLVKNGTGIALEAGTGKLYIDNASEAQIKGGSTSSVAITPVRQHQAVFYGLAKAAGDTTQSISTNAVGTYTNDAKAAIQTMLGVPGDVQVNGTSVVANGIANVPMASANALGVVKIGGTMTIGSTGFLNFQAVGASEVKAGTSYIRALTPERQHASVFYGLTKAAGVDMASSNNAIGTYTPEAKAAIQTMLGIDLASIAAQVDIPLIETVSGTTPTITGQPNVRYVCGEVSTISITPPASGSVDVIFESGSTATTMTVPSTVKWPAWFDAETLEANTTYEVLITDGIYGSVMTWAT